MQSEKCQIKVSAKADFIKLFTKGEFRNFAICNLQFAIKLAVLGGLT